MRKTILFAGLTVLSVGIGMMTIPASAEDREERMRHLHFDCDRGDRRACVRFGVMLGENHDHFVEWRRTHPEWWWWE
ncbi:MAG TPA: hypothetical protein VMB81_02015 [Candidatus Sulfotelmatobacter sp.]|nr:hypothetical protein [Candidatus Sulfotelmatobacter sp.]